MNGSEYSELAAFVAVAERSNFARAAAHLGIVPSTISQTVRSLEERLGVRLFNRTTRSVSLTDAGERLLQRVRPAIMEMDSAVEGTREFRDTPTGTLRLSVSEVAAQIVLAPVVKAFLQAYPAVVLDITIDDGRSELVDGRFDAGIRVGRRVAKDMQAIRVSEPSNLITIAAPEYLVGKPGISVPQDLQEHNCVRLRTNGQMLVWEFTKGEQRIEVAVTGSLVVDSMHWMMRAVLDGVGVGYTIESYVAAYIARGRLVPLLRDWSTEHHSYYLYYSGRHQVPAPLRAFIGFLREYRVRHEAVA